MAFATILGARARSVDLTASSIRNLLFSVALICGGLWVLVFAAMRV